MHNIYILTIFYTSQALLHVSMHPHHLQGVLSFHFAKVTKIVKVTKSIKSVDSNEIVTVDDKIQSIKRCALSAVIITVHGSCQLGGCINYLDCLIGVI
jgi:hypothetical protein